MLLGVRRVRTLPPKEPHPPRALLFRSARPCFGNRPVSLNPDFSAPANRRQDSLRRPSEGSPSFPSLIDKGEEPTVEFAPNENAQRSGSASRTGWTRLANRAALRWSI